MVPISYQLYSSRNFDLDETLRMLSRHGIHEVEGYAPLYQNLDASKQRLDQYGMSMPTGHFAIELVEEDPTSCLAIARTLQIQSVIVPFLTPDQRPSDSDGWYRLGQRLSAMGKPMRDAGLGFGWHNHDFEFLPCENGSLPLECLAESCPELQLELDLAWIHVSGQDPVAWVEKFSDRILAVHVKDRAPPGENSDEDGWADVGHGTMEWDRISAALNKAQAPRYILEHDNPLDPDRFVQRSLATVKAFQLSHINEGGS